MSTPVQSAYKCFFILLQFLQYSELIHYLFGGGFVLMLLLHGFSSHFLTSINSFWSRNLWLASGLVYLNKNMEQFPPYTNVNFDLRHFDVIDRPPPVHILYPRPSSSTTSISFVYKSCCRRDRRESRREDSHHHHYCEKSCYSYSCYCCCCDHFFPIPLFNRQSLLVLLLLIIVQQMICNHSIIVKNVEFQTLNWQQYLATNVNWD